MTDDDYKNVYGIDGKGKTVEETVKPITDALPKIVEEALKAKAKGIDGGIWIVAPDGEFKMLTLKEFLGLKGVKDNGEE